MHVADTSVIHKIMKQVLDIELVARVFIGNQSRVRIIKFS